MCFNATFRVKRLLELSLHTKNNVTQLHIVSADFHLEFTTNKHSLNDNDDNNTTNENNFVTKNNIIRVPKIKS